MICESNACFFEFAREMETGGAAVQFSVCLDEVPLRKRLDGFQLELLGVAGA